jgi:branched-chain amino acid transport system substrate-binding protein
VLSRARLTVACAAVAAGLAIAGCGSKSGSTSSLSPTSPETASTVAASGTTTGKSATGAPIILGNIGTYSGPIGSSVAPNVTVMKLWAKQVNAAGGINGHPVQIISVDDANDPGKNLTEAKDLVENRHVIGFVADASASAGFGSVDYRTSKSVPTIGGGLQDKSWFTSPMYFAEGPSAKTLTYGLLSQAKGSKFAYFGCNAGDVCKQFATNIDVAARQLGVPVVNRQTLGLAQTNFSANCLAARSAGATAVYVIGATATNKAVFTDCSRLGYHPTYYAVTAASNQFKSVAGVNVIAIQAWFPFFLTSGSPALEAWVQASKSVQDKLSVFAAGAWVSLNLFEKAAKQAIPAGATPTSAMLLKGLWGIKDDTLGGLSVPLTFTQGKPSPPGNCWIAAKLSGGQWSPIDGGKPQCAPASQVLAK